MRLMPLSLMGLADRLPFASSHSKCCGHLGFGQPRSNLSCHHCVIASAICGVILSSSRAADLGGDQSHRVVRIELAIVSEQRPDCSDVLIGQSHGGDIWVTSVQQAA
jgi:hypothetical protein